MIQLADMSIRRIKMMALAALALASVALLTWQLGTSAGPALEDAGPGPAMSVRPARSLAAAVTAASAAGNAQLPRMPVAASSTAPPPQYPGPGLKSMPGNRLIVQRAAIYGYGNFVANAIESAQPHTSYEAARLLARCKTVDRSIEFTRQYLNSRVGPGVDNRVTIEALNADEEIQRHCQAILAAQHEQYLNLLAIAAKGGVLGAASEYYQEFVIARRGDPELLPWFRDALVRDAAQGDITAIKALGCDAIGANLSLAQRHTYLAVLAAAAKSGRAAEYASVLVQYCGRIQEATTAADPRQQQYLLSAIEKVGMDYLLF
jgi:hypothetical protein